MSRHNPLPALTRRAQELVSSETTPPQAAEAAVRATGLNTPEHVRRIAGKILPFLTSHEEDPAIQANRRHCRLVGEDPDA